MRYLLSLSAASLTIDADPGGLAGRRFAEVIESSQLIGTGFFDITPGFVARAGSPDPATAGSFLPDIAISRAEVEESIARHRRRTGSRIDYPAGTVGLSCRDPFTAYGSQFFVCLADVPDLLPHYPIVGSMSVADLAVFGVGRRGRVTAAVDPAGLVLRRVQSAELV